MPFRLDYDALIHLDAEDLAETGIGKAYEALLPKLRQYVTRPATIDEAIDNESPCYSVKCGAKEYIIYSPDDAEVGGDSWGRATFAFFTIVNDQLAATAYRLYAINGGNDLFGMFLTPAQAEEARESLPNKRDWPHLPDSEHPRYGRPH